MMGPAACPAYLPASLPLLVWYTDLHMVYSLVYASVLKDLTRLQDCFSAIILFSEMLKFSLKKIQSTKNL
jgi:hypothetical protein